MLQMEVNAFSDLPQRAAGPAHNVRLLTQANERAVAEVSEATCIHNCYKVMIILLVKKKCSMQ